MAFRTFFASLILPAFLALGQPAPQTQQPPKQPEILPDGSQYLLGPGDQLRVWALGVEEITDKPIRVDPSGNIDLPTIGKIHADGLSLEQFKTELIARLSRDVLHPEVSVEIIEYGSQPVSIMGAVNHSGVHQLQGRKTLVEVISMAEGLRPDAGAKINISREARYGAIPLLAAKPDPSGKFSVADLSAKDVLSGAHPGENILIYPHDVITIPPAETVFVIGEVKKPGDISLKTDDLTVLQALAMAQGLAPTPSPQHAKLIRIAPGTAARTEIPVDLTKIMAGKSEDISMRANDILFIPSSVPKKVAYRALEAAIQAATGIAIWRRP